MAWIESHQELARHPKTLRLARLLGVSVPAAIGHLQLLWWWAMDFAQDGSLSAFEAEEIATAVMWDGDPDMFVEALLAAKFVDEAPDGYAIHDWHDYAGRLVTRKQANAERMRNARAKNVQGTCTGRAGATGPNRTLTGPDLTGPDNPSQTLPLRGKGSAGAGPISRDVVDRLSRLPGKLGAASFHAAAETVLSEIGFTCQREVQVDQRGDGHAGRVDLIAERGAERIAFQFDRSTPRQKSIRKLAGVRDAARVVVLRAPFDGPTPHGLDAVIGNSANGSQPLQDVQVTPATPGDREVWNLARPALAESSGAYFERAIEPLVPIGRAADGGLHLRAPPGVGKTAERLRDHIARALLDAGDVQGARVAIVEG